MNHKKELIIKLEECIEDIKNSEKKYIPAVVIVQLYVKEKKFKKDIHFFEK